ncbi:hypothetical protein DCAR_0314374 [Daucus carota subsp. sativus]|uniref:Uncharacterized protein n=2 Tax=Daucus carota subsp. sativus TaxID=79200 RepID=A0A169WJ24_DAUCS|nr:hypothetical protein DCAR_0314374 [Daucus carota subsp. sativus]
MASKLMHVVQYSSYGKGAANLQHAEIPIPTPKKGEVLVKVEAVGINPIDYKIQGGFLRPFVPKKFPHVPGSDIAGEVVELGYGVTKFKKGDKIVAMLGSATGGGLAEYAVAKEEMTVIKPYEVSAVECAGLGTPALTAYQCLITAGVRLDKTGPPMNVLVTAASGGVGHYAVQLAKLGNTFVTATCGARNAAFVRSLGADEILDYKTPEGQALISPSGRKYDAVIHCSTGMSWSTFNNVLSLRGKVVDITPSPSALATFAMKKLSCSKKQLIPLLVSSKAEDLQFLVKLMKEKKLRTVVDSRYHLSKAEDAWAKCIEGHAVGKIIVVA